MNEDTCHIVPANPPNSMNWQNIIIMVGLTLLSLLFCYLFYKFVSHTNQRFKLVETAINQMNDRIREKPAETMPSFQHLFIPQPQAQSPHIVQPPVRTQPAEVVVDSKVLDKELSEELKELNVSVEKHEEPEGRVDVNQEKPEPTATE